METSVKFHSRSLLQRVAPSCRAAISCAAIVVLGSCTTAGITEVTTNHAMPGPRIPGACELPADANSGKLGCYFDAAVEITRLPGPAYYHVDEFADRVSAERARTSGGAVVLAYDRVFLETVNADASWRPLGGNRLATVGPMPAPQGVPLTARFMQAMTLPGATTRPHQHDGPEAFYVLSGAICMETPDGGAITNAGQTYWVRGGVPMQLTSAGATPRRSLFVVLHATSQPWMTMAADWAPVGACAR